MRYWGSEAHVDSLISMIKEKDEQIAALKKAGDAMLLHITLGPFEGADRSIAERKRDAQDAWDKACGEGE